MEHALESEILRRPALLQSHDIGHGLTATPQARDSNGCSLEISDTLIFGFLASDNRPVRWIN